MSVKNQKSVAHLESHIKDLEKTYQSLGQVYSHFDLDLESLKQDMETLEKLVENLKTLDQSLETLDEILDLIMIIPEINIGACELKKAIDLIKLPIHKASIVSSDFDIVMKDVLTAVSNLKAKNQVFDRKIIVTEEKVGHFNTLVNQTVQCITSIPAGDFMEKQYDKMVQASVEVDTLVKDAIKLLILLVDSLNRINKEVEQIANKLKVLDEISEHIDKIISELNLITVPLKPLRNALFHMISVPYEGYTRYCRKWVIPYPCGWQTVYATFSVNQIISGLGGSLKPVEDMLKKEMNTFLMPLLKNLHFKTTLSLIPGLDSLSAKLQALRVNFIALPKEVDELLNKAGQLKTSIDAVDEKHGQWQQMQEICKKIKQ